MISLPKELCSERLGSVIKTDALTNKRADFLAVHVPFNKLRFFQSGRLKDSGRYIEERTDSGQYIDEDSLYTRYLLGDNNHQFMIIRGDNGTGKSHLIRWMYEKASNDFDSDTEAILFIQKHQSTLRDALDQLIKSDILQNNSKKAEMEKLLDASTHLDDDKLKNKLVHEFAQYIENAGPDLFQGTKRSLQRDVPTLLLDDEFKKFLMRENGAIERIYAKLVATGTDVNTDVDPVFYPEDFYIDVDLLQRLKMSSAKAASRLANKLNDEFKRDELSNQIIEILNNAIDHVIQECTQLKTTDLKRLFEQMRKELKKQGKNLTFFIEDITSFTGVDHALVDILVTEHTGTDNLESFCRLRSVVGITTAYYDKKFQDHMKDRVTSQVLITEDTFGTPDQLSRIAARYLNAIYQPESVFVQWLDNGADQEDLPIVKSIVPQWEYVNSENDNPMTLFPFTKKSLTYLFGKLEQKTPRLFLQQVIQKQLFVFLANQSSYPVEETLPQPESWKKSTHSSVLNNYSFDLQQKRRLEVLIRIWGEGHLYREVREDGIFIGGLHENVYKAFDLPVPPGISNDSQIEQKPAPPQVDPFIAMRQKPQPDDEYLAIVQDIEDWANGAPLKSFERLRDTLHDFIVTSIHWQAEGVSSHVVRSLLSTKRFIAIQGQTKNEQNAEFILQRKDGRMVLLALASWFYLGDKTWSFNDSAEYQFFLVNWLLDNKQNILDIFKPENNIMDSQGWSIIEWAVLVDYFQLALAGKLTGTELPEQIYKLMMEKEITFDERADAGAKWKQAIVLCQKTSYVNNHDLCTRYFNYVQGNASHQSDKFYIDATDLLKVIEKVSAIGWPVISANLTHESESNIRLWKNSYDSLTQMCSIINEVVKDEVSRADQYFNKMQAEIGFVSGVENIQEAITSMESFLNTLNNNQIPFSSKFQDTLSFFRKHHQKLDQQLIRVDAIIADDNTSKKLAMLSQNPFTIISQWVQLLLEFSDMVSTVQKKAQQDIDPIVEGNSDVSRIHKSITKKLNSVKYRYAKLIEGGAYNANS